MNLKLKLKLLIFELIKFGHVSHLSARVLSEHDDLFVISRNSMKLDAFDWCANDCVVGSKLSFTFALILVNETDSSQWDWFT